MPTSEINSVPPIIREVMRLQPKSVLDLGAGCGKYGALLREYLDGAHGRFVRHSWRAEINAVEAFSHYLTPMHYAVYNKVWLEDFAVSILKGNHTAYDVVLMVDSFEHLNYEEGVSVLDTLLANNKHIIISVPQGYNFLTQGAVFGNEYETHRTNWDDTTFLSRGGRLIFREICSVWSIPGKKL